VEKWGKMEGDGWFCGGGGAAAAWWCAVVCVEVERWFGIVCVDWV
jgi:hypothetical protein